MITCRLNVILAEKRLSRKELSLKTGISFNTLKPLYDDTLKGVQIKTINKICKALNIGVGELLVYKEE